MASPGAHIYLVSARVDTSQEIKGLNVAARLVDIQQQFQQIQEICSRSHKFKVVGEPLIIAVFEVDVGYTVMFHELMESLFDRITVTYECEVLISYEEFAEDILLASQDLTTRDSDDYIDGESQLLWCQKTLNFTGKPDCKAWEGATAFLVEREKESVKCEIFKVVGQPKIHAFVSMSPCEVEHLASKHPATVEVVKAVIMC